MDKAADTLLEVDAKTLGDTFVNIELVSVIERQLATHWATCKRKQWLTR